MIAKRKEGRKKWLAFLSSAFARAECGLASRKKSLFGVLYSVFYFFPPFFFFFETVVTLWKTKLKDGKNWIKTMCPPFYERNYSFSHKEKKKEKRKCLIRSKMRGKKEVKVEHDLKRETREQKMRFLFLSSFRSSQIFPFQP